MTAKSQTKRQQPPKKYCDIAKSFRDWLLSLECLQLNEKQVIQTADIEGCQRPVLWDEQTDSERKRCLDPQPKYKPGKVFLDLEIHAEDQDDAELIAGNLNWAMEQHPKQTSDFDFDGCKVCLMMADNQDSEYELKAPGVACGEYVVAMFVELQTDL